jgi:hypothetical protein
MNKLIPVFAVLLTCTAPALALPCVALDYQEMKDMTVHDLVVEACRAREVNEANFALVMSNLETRRGPKPFPDADAETQQCNSQTERMLRILKSKGVNEDIKALCEKQARRQAILPPAESK